VTADEAKKKLESFQVSGEVRRKAIQRIYAVDGDMDVTATDDGSVILRWKEKDGIEATLRIFGTSGCKHICQECEDQKKKIVGLVMKLDSYLSLLRYRHVDKQRTPDDLIREIDQLLGQAHGFEKSGRMA